MTTTKQNKIVKHAGKYHYSSCRFLHEDWGVCNCPDGLKPKQNKLEKLKLYVNGGISGYDSKEIHEFMETMGRGKEWSKWVNGSTGAIIDGHFIVYEYDVNRFIEGLPNND